jgi:hypothetical protein
LTWPFSGAGNVVAVDEKRSFRGGREGGAEEEPLRGGGFVVAAGDGLRLREAEMAFARGTSGSVFFCRSIR